MHLHILAPLGDMVAGGANGSLRPPIGFVHVCSNA
jgi:hypothetical protein